MMNNSTNARKGKHPYTFSDFWETNLEYFITTYPASRDYWIGLAEKDAKEQEKKAKSNYINWTK